MQPYSRSRLSKWRASAPTRLLRVRACTREIPADTAAFCAHSTGLTALERGLCVGSIIRWPRLLEDARAVAERDLRSRPALDGGGEGGARQQQVVHAGEVLVEVRAGGVVPAGDGMGVVVDGRNDYVCGR